MTCRVLRTHSGSISVRVIEAARQWRLRMLAWRELLDA